MNRSEGKTLALFDFDGTLTRYDSLFSFLRFYKGDIFFARKMIVSIPMLLANKLGFISNSRAKEILLSSFVKGISVESFNERCRDFAKEKLVNILNYPVIEMFHQHIKNGDKVLIVSASIGNWISPWAQQWNVEVLGTKLEALDGTLTGRLEGKNCNGIEKVSRIKFHLNLSDYTNIWAYGNSSGDEAMCGLANYVVYRGKLENNL